MSEPVGVRGHLYSAKVADAMREYVREVDALHDTCAKTFMQGLEEIRQRYRRVHKIEGKLPDE